MVSGTGKPSAACQAGLVPTRIRKRPVHISRHRLADTSPRLTAPPGVAPSSTAVRPETRQGTSWPVISSHTWPSVPSGTIRLGRWVSRVVGRPRTVRETADVIVGRRWPNTSWGRVWPEAYEHCRNSWSGRPGLRLTLEFGSSMCYTRGSTLIAEMPHGASGL